MICNNNYLADILRVCEIKDLIWVMRFQSPLVYSLLFKGLTVDISYIYLPSIKSKRRGRHEIQMHINASEQVSFELIDGSNWSRR